MSEANHRMVRAEREAVKSQSGNTDRPSPLEIMAIPAGTATVAAPVGVLNG